jgi:tetratricopeptide (TPR) repeat protein
VRYRAFISYSHADEAFAARLHRDLERYRLPRRVVQARGLISERLGVIFRDRDELASSASLTGTIQKALGESECLIVICSPASAASVWVGAEIDAFRRLRPNAPILPIIPPDVPGIEASGLFPPALASEEEPLAADARATGDGRQRALLKLIAALVDIRFDDLIERETVRRRQRMFTAAGVVMVSVTIASVLMYQARRAEQEAETRRAQATALIDYLVSDLTERLVEYEEVGELDQGLSQALNYFGAFEADELDDDTLDKYRSALIGVGSVRIRQGKLEEALETFERAMELGQVSTSRAENEPSEWYDLAQNTYYVGEAHWELQDIPQAADYIGRSLTYGRRAAALAPGNFDYRIEVVFGLNNMGAVNTRLKRYDQAISSLEESLAENEVLRREFPDKEDDLLNQEVESVSWLAEILPTLGEFEQGFLWHEKEISLREALYDRTNNIHHLARLSDALGYYARTLIAVGRTAEARVALARKVALSEQLTREDPENVFWRTRGYLGRVMLAMELHHGGDTAAALAELDIAEAGLADLLAEERNSDLVRLHLAYIAVCRAYFKMDEAPAQSLQALSIAFDTLDSFTEAETIGPVHFGYYLQAVLVESVVLKRLDKTRSDRLPRALALMQAQGQPAESIQDRSVLALLNLASGEGGPETAPRAEFYRRIYEGLSA